jgi:hypothetical protein
MITSEQVQAARALLRWEQRDPAETLKVSLPSNRWKIDAICTALESAGVEFIAENGGGAGARLAKPKVKRKSK